MEGTKTEEEKRTVMSKAAKSREEEMVWTVDGPFCQLSAVWHSPQSGCFSITLPPTFYQHGEHWQLALLLLACAQGWDSDLNGLLNKCANS